MITDFVSVLSPHKVFVGPKTHKCCELHFKMQVDTAKPTSNAAVKPTLNQNETAATFHLKGLIHLYGERKHRQTFSTSVGSNCFIF